MTALLVSGTGTGVGKTTVAAAVAALAVRSDRSVVVVKPAQTGEPDGGGGDVAEILRRAPHARGLELARYPDPLSPAAAARRSGRSPLSRAACVDAVRTAAAETDLVLVEGAGGLLVHYDGDGFTMADLAVELDLPVLLVTTPGLGTLNSTALTLEAMSARGLRLHGLVIGAWPATPDLADRSNVADLEALAGQPLGGALPAGAGVRDDEAFVDAARRGLSDLYGGAFDAVAFRQAASA
jgi:dethiobiotin synthetase